MPLPWFARASSFGHWGASTREYAAKKGIVVKLTGVQGPAEYKGPIEGARRPREFDVTLHCLQRETIKARKRKLAEKTKDEVCPAFAL